MADERLETQGHRHKITIEKVIAGRDLVKLVEGCKRCEEIKAEREEKDRKRKALTRRHPVAKVDAVLQELALERWTITPNKPPVRFLEIRCPKGTRKRIPPRGKESWDKLSKVMAEHERLHPGEWKGYAVHFPS